MQKIIINGNVGKDPEERFTKNGQKIVSFSLAVSNQDKEKTTTWYECQCWNDKTQDIIMQFVAKGSKLLIDGRPSINVYVDKTGKAAGSIQVTINTVEFIGSKKDEQQADSEPESTAQSAFNAPGPSLQSDDVPF
jgi:single-strand DNA-binding protein